MIGDLIKAEILAAKIIPDVHPELAGSLELGSGRHSLGLLTCSSDDVAYTALDEATKKADVKVVYARSLYAGSKNATTRFAGEFIGILAGPDPEQVRSGLEACEEYIQNSAFSIRRMRKIPSSIMRSAYPGPGAFWPNRRESGRGRVWHI